MFSELLITVRLGNYAAAEYISFEESPRLTRYSLFCSKNLNFIKKNDAQFTVGPTENKYRCQNVYYHFILNGI